MALVPGRVCALESTVFELLLSSPKQAPITKCASELLLGIASFVNQTGLLALALVSKQFREIAREILYRNVKLDYLKPEWEEMGLYKGRSPISRFAWTMKNRPDMLNKTRSLTWAPKHILVLYEAEVMYGMVGEAKYPEVKLAKALLFVLTGLRSLHFGQDNIVSRDLLGLDSSSMGSVPGLCNLRVISFQSGCVDFRWCLLPALRELRLGPQAHVEIPHDDDMATKTTPKISTLTLTCGYDPSTQTPVLPHPQTTRLLHHLLNLHTLTLHPSTTPPFHRPLNIFHAPPAPLPNKYQPPLPSLTPSPPTLTTLILPQQVLLQPLPPSTSLHYTTTITAFLPPSLHNLSISHPTPLIFPWLTAVADAREDIPHLSRITLVADTQARYMDVVGCGRLAGVRARFWGVGVELGVVRGL